VTLGGRDFYCGKFGTPTRSPLDSRLSPVGNQVLLG